MSRGMKPSAPAKATSPDPAGKLRPIGNRVWESPPVPIVSGKKKTVEPGMDDAVARPERNALPLGDETGQESVHLDVGRFGIGRGMTERLHEEVGLEFQAGEFLQARRRSSGRSCPGNPTVVIFGSQAEPGRMPVDPAGPADDLLGERIGLAFFRARDSGSE